MSSVTTVKQSKTFTVHMPENGTEAVSRICAGFWYLLRYRAIITIPVILALATVLHQLNAALTEQGIRLVKPTPIILANKPEGMNFSFMPQAYAGEQQVRYRKGELVFAAGQWWGPVDTTFRIWKLKDQPSLLVLDRWHDIVTQVDNVDIQHEDIDKQQQQGK